MLTTGYILADGDSDSSSATIWGIILFVLLAIYAFYALIKQTEKEIKKKRPDTEGEKRLAMFDAAKAAELSKRAEIASKITRGPIAEETLFDYLQAVRLPTEIMRSPARPPSHINIPDGVNLDYLKRDLAELIEQGYSLDQRLSTGQPLRQQDDSSEITDWRRKVYRTVFRNLLDPSSNGSFRGHGGLKLPMNAEGRPVPGMTAEADARIGLHFALPYLKELLDHMSQYENASNRSIRGNQINITGNVYGTVANTIDAINLTIAGVASQGNGEIASALTALKDAILADPTREEAEQRDMLDNLEVLAEEAGKAPNDRKRGIVKSVLHALNGAATSAPEIAKAMKDWGHVLAQLTN